MKIKTRILNPILLTDVASAIEKLGKKCILKLDPDLVQFTIVDTSGSHVWAQIDASSVFEEYTITSNNDNIIALDLQIDQYLRAIRSSHKSDDIIMKLMKINDIPYLSFSISSQTSSGPFSIIQEVPVRVLSRDEIERVRSPPVNLSDVDVHILLPSLTTLKNIVEKVKNLSNYMTISANMSGELQFKIQNDSSEVITYFKDLLHPEINWTNEDEKPASLIREPMKFAETRIETKHFLRFLSSNVLKPTNCICCILEDCAIILYVYFGTSKEATSSLTYYIPAIMK